jgi:hypothetical protein
MKKTIYIIFGIAASLLFSCDNYLDVNDSPNNPQYENIPPYLTLSAAQTQTYRVITGDNRNITGGINGSSMNQLGNIWMVSWSGNSNVYTSVNVAEYTVNLTTGFYDEIWDYTYRNVANFESIINYDSEDFDNHKAIAKILKSFYMQYIVDLYGDCPYSEAFLGDKNLFPTYDDDAKVYQDLYTNLEEAIALIDNANSSDRVVGAEDAMMAGNMANWRKFANTIKLRLLVRQSGTSNSESLAFFNDKVASLATESFIDADVTINPGYGTSNSSAQNPFYAQFGYNISGSAVSSRNYVTATKFAADALNGVNTFVADPRAPRLFVGATTVGIRQGDDAAAAPDNPSYLGPAVIPTDTNIGSAMSGSVMSLAEAKFLLAEASLLYPAFSSYDAQTQFTQGIEASFVKLGLTAAQGTAYAAAIDSANGFGWSGSANKIEAIMTQKWIATMHTHAIEAWIDYVRTGFPVTPLPTINTTGRPKTLLYPASEYSTNTANVPNRTQATAFTTPPFWGQ